MRNFKRFLSLVMATLMILSVAVITTGAADTTADYTDAAQHLVALKIMKGDNGNLMLDQGVTRYQAALFFVQTVSGETDATVWNAQKTSANFKDVVEYGTAIDYAYGRKLVVGRGNGIFGYNDPITYQDMLVMAVRALGYETEDMSYPYGYILAAQKLGLTDDVAKTVNYTAPLTRGETAQIMWNMLNTEIAVEDPISGKILYPGDKGLTNMILDDDKQIERVTLLEDAGYASGKIEGVITEFVEAEDDDEVDTVTVKTEDYGDLVIAAADLGITAKTPKVGYLGLPVTLLVDVAAEDFEEKYDTDADKSDASVVYTEFEDYTTVENLGNAGNIKVTEDSMTLGGTKFLAKNVVVDVLTFTADGWKSGTDDADAFFDNFYYTTKDGYDYADNSYGKVQYRVIEDGYTDDKDTEDTKDDVVYDVIEVLYTPYTFGQYFTRTIRYNATSKDATFATMAQYEETAYKNFDDTTTNFVEYLLGAKTTTKVSSSTTSVSKNAGEKAMAVTLEGESVKSGDFVFYSYNAVDNILTVAQNCGSFKEGRLTGSTPKNDTVKIDGVNKAVGFKGAFTTAIPTPDASDVEDFLAALEAGKNNVKYIEADGNVVYMEVTTGSSSSSNFDYAIVTVAAEQMAKLLGITVEKYNNSLTSGVYVNDDGYVAIAVLNKATGKFELASLKNFYYGTYDADDGFATKKDVATIAKYDDMLGEDYKEHDALEAIKTALSSAAVFLVVDEKNGVYDLAGNTADVDVYDTDAEFLDYGDETSGLVFSDTVAKTNKLKATQDADVDAARVTLDSNTVIVVIKGTAVKVRVGVQKSSKSVNLATGTAKILSANSSLIVMDATGTTFADGFNLEKWGTGVSASATETYYIALADVAVDIDTADDDTYDVTVTNLFDLRTLKKVDSVTVNVEDYDTAKEINTVAPGSIVYMDEDGAIDVDPLMADGKTYVTPAAAALMLAEDDDLDLADLSTLDFVDSESISLKIGTDEISADDVTKINIKVVTLDVTGIDAKKYDYDRAIVAAPVDDEMIEYYKDVSVMEEFTDEDAGKFFFYTLATDEITDVTEPMPGVFDNFVVDFSSALIVIPGADAEYGDYANISAFAAGADYKLARVYMDAFGEYKDGALDLTVFKIVFPAD